VVFDRPIGQNQGIQFPIADAYIKLQSSDLMVRKATAMFEAGQSCGAEANCAKFLSSEALWACAEACFTTHGGFAFAREYDVERKWREARLSRNAPISPNMIMNFIGQHVLGLPRSY
jgi:acyl-CoA dehydrogenase